MSIGNAINHIRDIAETTLTKHLRLRFTSPNPDKSGLVNAENVVRNVARSKERRGGGFKK